MATMSQIQKGFVKFVDNYIATAYSGFDRILVSGTATLMGKNMGNIVREYCSDPKIRLLGVYNEEAGTLDVDTLHEVYVRPMTDEKLSFPLPKLGFLDLGIIKLGKPEMEALIRYIQEA